MARLATVLARRELPADEHPIDALHGDAARCVWEARGMLADMAIDCLNMTRAQHRGRIAAARSELREALGGQIGSRAAGAIGRVEMALGWLMTWADRLPLDQLGDEYNVAEMRLAAILLADIEQGAWRRGG